MPFPAVGRFIFPVRSITCYSMAEEGKLHVSMNTLIKVDGAVSLVYQTPTNKWSLAAGLRSSFVTDKNWRLRMVENWRSSRPGWWVTLPHAGERGCTSVAVSTALAVFWIAERMGDYYHVMMYDVKRNRWRRVGGDRFPGEKLRRPFEARGIEGRIYVTSPGLNMAIGMPREEGGCMKLRWEVVEAPQAFTELVPYDCNIVYA